MVRYTMTDTVILKRRLVALVRHVLLLAISPIAAFGASIRSVRERIGLSGMTPRISSRAARWTFRHSDFAMRRRAGTGG